MISVIPKNTLMGFLGIFLVNFFRIDIKEQLLVNAQKISSKNVETVLLRRDGGTGVAIELRV